MQVNVHTAKTQLSKLIEAAERGEEVVIARNGRPVVRLEAIEPRPKGVVLGSMADLAGTVPDFLEPMSEEDRAQWDGPLFPEADDTRARPQDDGIAETGGTG